MWCMSTGFEPEPFFKPEPCSNGREGGGGRRRHLAPGDLKGTAEVARRGQIRARLCTAPAARDITIGRHPGLPALQTTSHLSSKITHPPRYPGEKKKKKKNRQAFSTWQNPVGLQINLGRACRGGYKTCRQEGRRKREENKRRALSDSIAGGTDLNGACVV